jgi:hypothetical protein
MFISQKHLSRRTVLKGLGAAIALPALDAMTPALASARTTARTPPRLICIEMVHGAAGSSALGLERNLWAPAAVGREFDLTPTSLNGLAAFRDHLTIVSNTDVACAEPYEAREIGGDHFRSSAVYLTQVHPKLTDGADVEAGTSLDQIYAARVGRQTPTPSMQLCIEDVDQGGACGLPYACAYTDSISWASPTQPLPMIRNPRVVFDEMFGGLASSGTRAEQQARQADDRSILDWLGTAIGRLNADLGAGDRRRLADYLDNIREIERRLQAVEAFNASGEARVFPAAPQGVPDSFTEHIRLMFDLQLVALRSDITRVFAFKLGRDNSNRVYPESGFTGAFHPTSHHSGKIEKILDFAKLNQFHVSQLSYLLERMRDTPDGDGSLLDNSAVLYGSPMGDSNLHNHKKVPFFIAGHAGGRIKGGRHIKALSGTPLANAMLGVLHALGADDITQFGDSDGALDLSMG